MCRIVPHTVIAESRGQCGGISVAVLSFRDSSRASLIYHKESTLRLHH